MTIHMTLPEELRGAVAAVPARVVALSERQAAIFFDLDARALPPRPRIVALSDGVPFSGSVVVTRLAREDGARRHVLLIARAAAEICAASIVIKTTGTAVARIDPMALQSPLVDPLAMIAGLSEAGRLRLLKLLLTTGASLFGKGELGGFGVLVGQLVESLSAPLPLSAACPVGRAAVALSWRLPIGTALPEPRDLCILHDGRAKRLTQFDAFEEKAGGAQILHLLVSRPLPEGAELIVLGERPVRLCGPRADATRSLSGWLERRNAETRAKALDWLDGLAEGDAQVASLRDELACPPGVEPRIGVVHLSETPAGLLYLLSVDDPRDQLVGLRIAAAGETVDVDCGELEWHATAGHVVTGFAPLTGRSGGAVSIAPVYRSGRVGASVQARPEVFDGCVPEAFEGLAVAVAAPALARAIPAAMRARPVRRRRVKEFSAMPAAPRLALLISAGEAPEHLHAVLARLAMEPGGRKVEVVVVHGDGPATEMVRQTVETLSLVHRIGLRLVSVAGEAFMSERLRAALAETRAPAVLALGPGCVPDGAGWLARWRRRITSGPAPRVVKAAAIGYAGSDRGLDGVIGLNQAAIGRLVPTRPLLPEVVDDLAATRGLSVSSTRGLAVTTYQADMSRPLVRETSRLVVAAHRETEDV